MFSELSRAFYNAENSFFASMGFDSRSQFCYGIRPMPAQQSDCWKVHFLFLLFPNKPAIPDFLGHRQESNCAFSCQSTICKRIVSSCMVLNGRWQSAGLHNSICHCIIITMNMLYIMNLSPSQHGACMQLSGVWAHGGSSCSSSLGRSKEGQSMRPHRSHSKPRQTDFIITMSSISSCLLLLS